MGTSSRLTIVMIADVPQDAVVAFQEYESKVIPLVDRHDGRLERRLSTSDSRVEVHIVSFGSRDGYVSYLADPERVSHRQLLDGTEVGQRVLETSDVKVRTARPATRLGGPDA